MKVNMQVNPKSLTNLRPGANKKGAIRVTLTLKPETVKLLRMTGNMSEAVDKFIELIKQGCVKHDGMLNPIAGTEPEKPESQSVHSSIEAIAQTDRRLKPDYWVQVLTRKEMIDRGFRAHRLDNMPYGAAIRDANNELWWKESIGPNNEYLRPLGSRANTVWCR